MAAGLGLQIGLASLGTLANVAGGLASYKAQQDNLRSQVKDAKSRQREAQRLKDLARENRPLQTVGKQYRDLLTKNAAIQAYNPLISESKRTASDMIGVQSQTGRFFNPNQLARNRQLALEDIIRKGRAEDLRVQEAVAGV